ncbi:MAG: Nif3-like dinuclear metal center hexameric protein [Phycisphaerae bacterium]
MKVRHIVKVLERIAPPQLAADWDNVGLLIGDADADVRKLLLTIDLTADVLAEARRTHVQMVMAYHPLIFKPLSRLTASDTPVAYEVARSGLSVYSTHTALDAAPGGTNDVLAEVLGLSKPRPLSPFAAAEECKVVTFVPGEDASRVARAAFAAGAGQVGDYSECGFYSQGTGSFLGGEGSSPAVGQAGRHESVEELRFETVAPRAIVEDVVAAVKDAHPYEEPVVDVYPLVGGASDVGMGRIGELQRPVTVRTLINRVKKVLGLKRVLVAGRPTGNKQPKITTAACCAGSCGSMFRSAAAAGAGFYLTGEMRHHDALAAAAEGMTVVCTGHSNSERITLSRLAERLGDELPKLNVSVSSRDRDPFEIV